MHINLELYRIFYITAKLGSISKAAKELFTSQPAVSQSIKLLEKKLGGQLFYRNPKGVSLTTEGEVLFKYIEQGYGLIQTAERKFWEIKNLKLGQVRIGVSDTLCKYYLIPYLEKYNKTFPDIKIYVANYSTYKIIDLLESGEVDLGILNLPVDKKDTLDIVETLKIQDCFVVGEKYKNIAKNPISIEDLSNYPIILLEEESNSRNFINNYFESHGVSVSPEIELGTIDLLVEFAKIGLGVSCVVKDFIKEELEQQQLYEITVKETIPKRSIGIATVKGFPISTAAERFIEFIKE
ncbi:transcriptional regulator LysR family [Gottschalkia purinilytica]|uniref:Transcriptional regulator LysR family n=1 Tax=Gottschalkia purinilytica TaxID=1503 RepID=A0A0L0W6G8_GOTPU|nr:LysR family transcriptional regulator [Gottschalkia purinilytica]KNF07119.1 transcriptional regulator LysR family [Gottschalkia purinilytica]